MQVDTLDIRAALDESMRISGAIGAAIVDYETGMCLGTIGGGPIDMELAAAGNTEVVRAKKSIRTQLGLTDRIHDILITLDTQYHLIRLARNNPNLFFYLAIDKEGSNLALARMRLKQIDAALDL
ncbi:MAG: hypothetical protein AAGG50_06565 [Bacteroidota bacterium]